MLSGVQEAKNPVAKIATTIIILKVFIIISFCEVNMGQTYYENT